MNRLPLISIGIPAYNSQAHIASAIEGLLAQTLGDFELIVSDNASIDGTRDIVESYVKLDSRIRYERQLTNIGANGNYSHLVRCARGKFFKWSSSSDWCAPTFLIRCADEFRSNPDSVLVVPRTRLFQDVPSVSQDYLEDIEILEESPSARLAALTSRLALNNAMNGLIRTSALRRTRLIEPYLAADVVLMGHLALLGKFKLLPEFLLYRRMDVNTATALQEKGAVWRHHYPQMTYRMLFQGTKRHIGWFRAVLSAPIAASEKMRAIEHVSKCCFWQRRVFLDDLRGAWRFAVRGAWPD